jgi:alpha-N-arabinofuranosidase
MLFKSHRSNTAVHVDADEKAPISASASKSANKLVISLVNTRSDADLTVACALRGVRATSGSAQVLHDPDLNAFNSFDQPDRIIPKTLPVNVEAQSVRVELPRLSVATITLQTSA